MHNSLRNMVGLVEPEPLDQAREFSRMRTLAELDPLDNAREFSTVLGEDPDSRANSCKRTLGGWLPHGDRQGAMSLAASLSARNPTQASTAFTMQASTAFTMQASTAFTMQASTAFTMQASTAFAVPARMGESGMSAGIQRVPTPTDESPEVAASAFASQSSRGLSQSRTPHGVVTPRARLGGTAGVSPLVPRNRKSEPLSPYLGTQVRRPDVSWREDSEGLSEAVQRLLPAHAMLLTLAAMTYAVVLPPMAGLSRELSLPLLVVFCVCDAILVAEVLIRRVRPIEHLGVLERKPKRIAEVYREGWVMHRDIVTAVPTPVFYYLAQSATGQWGAVLLLNKAGVLPGLSDQTSQWLGVRHPALLRLLNFATCAVFIIHCVASLLVKVLLRDEEGAILWLGATGETFARSSDWERYILALDWAVKGVSGTTRGGIPVTDEQTVVAAITILVGVGMLSTLVATVDSYVRDLDRVRSRFNEKVDLLRCYMHNISISKSDMDEVIGYYRHLFNTCKALVESDALAELPIELKDRVQAALARAVLQRIPLLSGAERGFSEALASVLELSVLLPGTLVFVVGMPADACLFIIQGTLEVLDEDWDVVCELTRGDAVGDVELLAELPYALASVRAVTYCNVYVLQAEHLSELDRDFPDSLRMLRQEASMKYSQARRGGRARRSVFQRMEMTERPTTEMDSDSESSGEFSQYQSFRQPRTQPASIVNQSEKRPPSVDVSMADDAASAASLSINASSRADDMEEVRKSSIAMRFQGTLMGTFLDPAGQQQSAGVFEGECGSPRVLTPSAGRAVPSSPRGPRRPLGSHSPAHSSNATVSVEGPCLEGVSARTDRGSDVERGKSTGDGSTPQHEQDKTPQHEQDKTPQAAPNGSENNTLTQVSSTCASLSAPGTSVQITPSAINPLAVGVDWRGPRGAKDQSSEGSEGDALAEVQFNLDERVCERAS